MRREGEMMSRTTKKWIVIALGTAILALTYLGVIKDVYRLYYGIMCCLCLYAYVIIGTPVSWDHPKGFKSWANMYLQESLRIASLLLFVSIFMGPEDFKEGTLLAIGLGLVLGLAVGTIRYRTHIG